MKRVLIILLVLSIGVAPAQAFLYEVKAQSEEEIQKMSNEELLDAFIDAKIEADASRTFHGKAGFNPKEYQKYKSLLRYIIYLRKEMNKRDIDAPPVNEWLN